MDLALTIDGKAANTVRINIRYGPVPRIQEDRLSKHEYDALGEEFERKENQLFHGTASEKNVDAVAKLEKDLVLRSESVHTGGLERWVTPSPAAREYSLPAVIAEAIDRRPGGMVAAVGIRVAWIAPTAIRILCGEEVVEAGAD